MKKLYAALPAALLYGDAAAENLLRHDTFLSRLETLALIETLNAELLAAHSATLTLDQWCADHHLAPDPKIHARRGAGPDKPISQEQRERLQIGADEPIRYRRVALVCGDHVLSEADNWYVPSRLTPEMNRLLLETDTPFGRVVQDLHPTRETFAAKLLYQPLDKGWEMAQAPQDRTNQDHADQALVLPHYLFEHRAILFDANHLPFSEVNEIYTRAVLDFPAPDGPR